MEKVKSEGISTIKLSVPIILSEIAQMSSNLIGMTFVGNLSYQNLAIVSVINSLINIPFIVCVGISIGMIQKLSFSLGKSKLQDFRKYLISGLFSVITLSFIFAVLISFIDVSIFFKNSSISIPKSQSYLELTSWGLIPLMFTISLKHYLESLGDTFIAMVFSILAFILNLIISYVLIFGLFGFPDLGLIGIPYSAICINVALIILILVYIYYKSRKKFSHKRIHGKLYKYISLRKIKVLFKIGLPMGAQLGIEIGAFALAAIFVEKLGPIAQASYQITFSCMIFGLMAVLGLAQGTIIRISKSYGQEDGEKLTNLIKSSIYIVFIYGIILSIIFIIFKNKIPIIFTSQNEVVRDSSSLIYYCTIFYFFNSLQIVILSVLRGINDVKNPTLYLFISYWVIGIPFIFFTIDHLGVKSIWIGFSIGSLFAILMYSFRLKKILNHELSII